MIDNVMTTTEKAKTYQMNENVDLFIESLW